MRLGDWTAPWSCSAALHKGIIGSHKGIIGPEYPHIKGPWAQGPLAIQVARVPRLIQKKECCCRLCCGYVDVGKMLRRYIGGCVGRLVGW